MQQRAAGWRNGKRILLMLAGLSSSWPVCGADGPLAVDVVVLKAQRSLRGAVLDRRPDGSMAMAVSRAWLEQADAQEFARQVARDAEMQRNAWIETHERIESELTAQPDAPRLVFFLKQERTRLKQNLDADKPEATPFLLIEIPASHVAKFAPAAAEGRRIAIFAWNEGLAGVETTSAKKLTRQLAAAGVDVDGPVPDLSDQLPARPQSDAEWQARLAIVKYTLVESLDFQGMGDTLIRTGDGQQFDLADVLPKLLAAQVDSLLGELLEPAGKPRTPDPTGVATLRPAIAIAERNHQRGFRVTRLDLNAERKTLAVQTDFVVKPADRDWQTIWTHTEIGDGSIARPDAESQIADDPQVKTLLKSLGDLGLAANDDVTQAIRIGAATQSAQQAADARFFEFRDRYVRRLDGPLLPLPGRQNP